MGYKQLKNTNNKTSPTQRLRQLSESPSSNKKLPSSVRKRSSVIKLKKCSQLSQSFCFSCQFISQIEIISWTIICLVIMIPIDRIGVNCTMLDTMLDSRFSMNDNFKVNEWIEDDLMGDSDNQFVERVDDNIDMDRLQNIIIQGLNLTRVPDVSKVSPSNCTCISIYTKMWCHIHYPR